MITIRPSTPEEIPQQKALWQKCFGDPMSYIDTFYDRFCTPEQVLVVVEDGHVNSMAAMPSTSIRTPEGDELPVGYVYALATDPARQGKGHARELLQYADNFLAERGDKAMVLTPASPSLHKFFSATGMIECFCHRKSEFLASSLTGDTGGGTFTPIGPEEYNEIRNAYLKGSFHVAYPDDLIRLQEVGSQMTGGGLYRVEVNADDAEVGCAAVEYLDDKTLVMKELLTYHQYTRRAVEMAAKVLPARRYLLRTPAVWEGFQGNYTQPFAMIKWYDRRLHAKYLDNPVAYMGLAFD